MKKLDILIIGAGVTGLYLSILLKNAGMNFLVIDGHDKIGGQLRLYEEKYIYDLPGILKITGKELIDMLFPQISMENFLFSSKVFNIKNNNNGKIVEYYDINGTQKSIEANILIGTVGYGLMKNQTLNLKNIEEIEATGKIHYQVTNFNTFHNKVVGIFGGGDTAIDWALSLSQYCKKVYIFHRRNDFSCLPYKIDLLKNAENISICMPWEITNINYVNNEINCFFTNMMNEQQKCEIHLDEIIICYGLQQDVNSLNIFSDSAPIQIGTKQRFQVNANTMKPLSTENVCDYLAGDIAMYENKRFLIHNYFAEAERIFNQITKNK